MTEENTATTQETDEISLDQFAVEGSLSATTVRLSGMLAFAILIGISALFIWDFETFIDIATDIRITIPLVVLMYFLRVAFQYIALFLFSGIEKKQIRLGFSSVNLSPFVHAKRPFELKRFRYYMIIPALCLAIIPLSISLILSSPAIYFCASFALAFCISDVISFFRSLKMNSKMLAADHPKLYGFVLYENPFE